MTNAMNRTIKMRTTNRARDERTRDLLYGQPVGILQQDHSGNRKFQFVPQDSRQARLSLAMPYRETPYQRSITDPFIEGLIPECEAVRQSFADDFGISAKNPFALLEHIGFECAGAVQFVRPDE